MFSVLYKYTSNHSLSEPVKASQMEPVKSCLDGRSQFLLKGGRALPTGDLGAGIYSGRPALRQRRKPGKSKGCDIGYALATSSCEGANSVEACTVTALDVIVAFAVPNPNCPSQSGRFFQVWLLFGLPRRADHSAYFGLAKV